VFHSYQPNPEGHGINEWFKNLSERVRIRSLTRIKTALELKDGDKSDTAKANLGIYGIGKRRTLAQLDDFVGTSHTESKGNEQVGLCQTRPLLCSLLVLILSFLNVGPLPKNMNCANLKFVPYDTQISPADNLYDNPNDLDTQPEFPRRTDLIFYKQVEQVIEPPGTGRELVHGTCSLVCVFCEPLWEKATSYQRRRNQGCLI
jgi:hypothetical protein